MTEIKDSKGNVVGNTETPKPAPAKAPIVTGQPDPQHPAPWPPRDALGRVYKTNPAGQYIDDQGRVIPDPTAHGRTAEQQAQDRINAEAAAKEPVPGEPRVIPSIGSE